MATYDDTDTQWQISGSLTYLCGSCIPAEYAYFGLCNYGGRALRDQDSDAPVRFTLLSSTRTYGLYRTVPRGSVVTDPDAEEEVRQITPMRRGRPARGAGEDGRNAQSAHN